MSLLLLIARASKSPIRRLARNPKDGSYVDAGLHERLEIVPKVLTLRLDGPLFFADAERFKESVYEHDRGGSERPEAIALDADSISLTDTDGADALIDLATELHDKRSLRFAVARAQAPVWQLWERAGLASVVVDGRASTLCTRRSTASMTPLSSKQLRHVTRRRRRDAVLGAAYPLPCRKRIARAAQGDHDPLVCGPGFRQRAEYRFGLVLVLLLATFTFMAAGSHRRVDGCCGGAVARRDPHRRAFGRPSPRGLIRVAALVTVVALVVAAAAGPDRRDGAQRFRGTPQCAPRRPGADRDRVVDRASTPHRRPNGARSALHLRASRNVLGVRLRGRSAPFGSDPFFAQEASPTSASYLYFAYVTLTTVGYGDLTASGNLGRALAVLDALLGQIYLVTVVALLVSQLGRTRLTDNSDG